MKLQLIAAFALLPAASFAVTNVTFQNFSGVTSGFPIVDNTGTPIASTDLRIEVGTFSDAFAGTFSALDLSTSDADVAAAFTPTGSSVPANPTNIDGVFNTVIGDADSGNSLVGQSVFLVITDTSSADLNLIVLDLGTSFPTQDASGAGTIPSIQIDLTNVVFGFVGEDGLGAAVDTTNLEALNAGFATGFENGIAFDAFDAIPEPSTSLLAGLAGLALVARRRR